MKSAAWAQDEEFTSLIHSLPSWANMYSQDRPHRTKMAQRDVYLYAEEAQKFMEHFADEDVTSSQVVLDPSDLRRIAQVHESVVRVELHAGYNNAFSTSYIVSIACECVSSLYKRYCRTDCYPSICGAIG